MPRMAPEGVVSSLGRAPVTQLHRQIFHKAIEGKVRLSPLFQPSAAQDTTSRAGSSSAERAQASRDFASS